MIVWDEAKREANLKKHGLDFADAHMVYDNPGKITYLSPRGGENRLVDIAMVKVHGKVLTLAYIERDAAIRVISFRAASRKERKVYEKTEESN